MPTDRPTRRSFLKAHSALRELATGGPPSIPLAESAGRDAPPGGSSESPLAVQRMALLASVRRRAMACDWEVQLSATRDDDSMEHVFAALDLVEALEGQMTVYRDDSEVMHINRHAADAPVLVEPRLFALLQMAQRMHHDTWGAIDITSGPLSDAWGFSRRKGRLPSAAEIAAALERVGMDHVVLDESNLTIAFRKAGISVNFNSIGKGYALDRMAELLAEGGVDDYLLHGGRSSVLARGDQPGRKIGTETRRQGDKEIVFQKSPGLPVSGSPGLSVGWQVGLRHPLRPQERLGVFCLRNEALSTSGAGTQFFRRRGRRYGHILDPHTGWPVEGIYSATAIAPTAAEAEALSTAFYVMGPDKVAEFCANRPELAALLVLPADREGEVELHAFGLDDTRWEALL